MVNWLSDDDVAVTTVDLRSSTDGGATHPTLIASSLPARGEYPWTVPLLEVKTARVRVVAHDGSGNSGSGDTTGGFVMSYTDWASLHANGQGCAGWAASNDRSMRIGF